MHTSTNFFLFSLAISDITILFVGKYKERILNSELYNFSRVAYLLQAVVPKDFIKKNKIVKLEYEVNRCQLKV